MSRGAHAEGRDDPTTTAIWSMAAQWLIARRNPGADDWAG
jgi:hypothetical protein